MSVSDRATGPWRKQHMVYPAEASEAFVTNMEDVLDLYARPEDPRRPVVCVDLLRREK